MTNRTISYLITNQKHFLRYILMNQLKYPFVVNQLYPSHLETKKFLFLYIVFFVFISTIFTQTFMYMYDQKKKTQKTKRKKTKNNHLHDEKKRQTRVSIKLFVLLIKLIEWSQFFNTFPFTSCCIHLKKCFSKILLLLTCVRIAD